MFIWTFFSKVQQHSQFQRGVAYKSVAYKKKACNISLQSGVFPEEKKIARVTSIFKRGEQVSDLGNYCPISVLCCFSKILKTIMMYNDVI